MWTQTTSTATSHQSMGTTPTCQIHACRHIPASRPSKAGLVATLSPGCGMRKQERSSKHECMCLRTTFISSCWLSEICTKQQQNSNDNNRQGRKGWNTSDPYLEHSLKILGASILPIFVVVWIAPVTHQKAHGLSEKEGQKRRKESKKTKEEEKEKGKEQKGREKERKEQSNKPTCCLGKKLTPTIIYVCSQPGSQPCYSSVAALHVYVLSSSFAQVLSLRQ